MAFIRALLVLLLGLTVIYVCVAWYCRSVRRENLEKQWDAANPGGDHIQRGMEVEKGVESFTASWAYRALWLIYVVPIGVATMIYIYSN